MLKSSATAAGSPRKSTATYRLPLYLKDIIVLSIEAWRLNIVIIRHFKQLALVHSLDLHRLRLYSILGSAEEID